MIEFWWLSKCWEEKNTDKKNTSLKKNIKGAGKKANKTKAKQPIAKSTDQSKAETTGFYKIITKAYFHNKPDEATRRNAFLVHWNNSYAKLKALDEKNGFIYVVFHNHLNQTSKGWLRKKDLEPIGE